MRHPIQFPPATAPTAALAAAVVALLCALPAAPPAAAQESDATQTEEAPAAAAAPAEDPAAAGRQKLIDSHQYLLRDGGRWRADNPRHVAGADTPARFGYAFDWAMDRAAVMARIFMIYEDGREVTTWRGLTAWDPETGEVVLFNVSKDGDVARGVYHDLGGGSSEILLDIAAAGGGGYQIRDVSSEVGPDEFTSETHVRPADGEWQKISAMTWKRVGQ